MKTSRLKNITIVILALVNVCLLALLSLRRGQERVARERTVSQLVALYEANGVSLSPSVISEDARLSAIEPARSLEEESAFARAILGVCSADDVGGGIYRYASGAGQCLLRASGAVDAALDRRVEDPAAFCADLCADYGYETVESSLADGSGSVRIVRRLSGGEVFNAELELLFAQNRLLSVTGAFLPAADSVQGGGEGINAVTALVRFLDYSNASGEVCTAILDERSGYLLQSTASASLRLIPVWCITTDVNRYFVNFGNGEVTRDG